MKNSHIIFFLLIQFACSKSSENKSTLYESDSLDSESIMEEVAFEQVEKSSKTLKDSSEQNNRSLIKFIKSQSHLRKDTLSLEDFNHNISFPKVPDYIRKLIEGQKVENSYNTFIESDIYNIYNFLDYFEDDSYFYFRVLIDNETCCRSLYVITLDKITEARKNISFLALRGGDGGWSEFDYEKWISDTTIRYTKVSTYDQDIELNAYKRTVDSLIVDFTILNGRFVMELIDSVHYEITIDSN